MEEYKVLSADDFLKLWFESTAVDNHGARCARFERIRVYEHIQFGKVDFPLPNLILKNCQINRIVSSNVTIDDITISDSSIGYIVIGYKTQVNRVWIYNSCFDGIVINADTLNRFRIFDGSAVTYLGINFCKSISCNINDSKINYISFDETMIDETSTFQIHDCIINSIIFKECINKGNIIMSNIEFANQVTEYKDRENKYVSSDNEFLLTTSTESPSQLVMVNSDLGKTSFLSCSLDKISGATYFNTKISDIYTANTRMPEKIKLPDSHNDSFESQQKLYFSQVKKNYENRGDTINAARFQVLELESYRSSIKKSIQQSPFAQKILKTGDYILLWINYQTNRHGTDWVRASIILLCISSFCFIIYCRALGFKFGNDMSLFLNLLSHSFEYLNPLRGADWFTGFGIKENFSSRIWDYFSRILVAFLVYQFVVPFRRFGKNSN